MLAQYLALALTSRFNRRLKLRLLLLASSMAATGVKYHACTFAGDNPNVAWLWGDDGTIAVTRNLNATTPTIRDLSGNLSSFTSPSVGRVLNIFGV